jgi:hypothetical protein
MNKLRWLLYLIGTLQIVLGVAYLVVPDTFLQLVGHSIPTADLHYPLGMLASRFIAYGVALFVIARDPLRHVLWLNIMLLIQLIDLGVGAVQTAIHAVPLSLSAFPMFNAAWIIVLLWWWRPTTERAR